MNSCPHGTSPRLPGEAPPGGAYTASGQAARVPVAGPDTRSGPPEETPADTAGEDSRTPSPLRREPVAAVAHVTVALVENAADDLQRTHARTALSKTDIINRAVSFYEFIDAELSTGAELIVRRNGHDNLLKLL